MSTAITFRAGQRGKIIRIQTGYNMAASDDRIVRLRREEDEAIEVTGVPYDPLRPTDLLFTVAAGQLDTVGTYALEVEVQEGTKVLKPDVPSTIEVFGLGEVEDD